MRFNERQLVNLASGNPDLEDRLWLKKKSPGSFKKEVFKHRWLRLKYNMLFYFKFTETGQIYEEPDGVIFLVDCEAKILSDGGASFTFSLTFGNSYDKIVIFSTKDQEALLRWVSAINNASYENLRRRALLLRNKTNGFVK